MPAESASLFLMAAPTCDAGSQSGEVAIGSLDKIRLDRAPHMKYNEILGPNVGAMGRAPANFRRVAKETHFAYAVRAHGKGRQTTQGTT